MHVLWPILQGMGVFVAIFWSVMVGTQIALPRAIRVTTKGDVKSLLTGHPVLILTPCILGVLLWVSELTNGWIALVAGMVGGLLVGYIGEKFYWRRMTPEKTDLWLKEIEARQNKYNEEQARLRREVESSFSPAAPAAPPKVDGFQCGSCRKQLAVIGIPPQVQLAQAYGRTVNIGPEVVPPEIKADPFLYRGLYCPTCNEVFCPQCARMQSVNCPRCGLAGLMPGYRPLLQKIARRETTVVRSETAGS